MAVATIDINAAVITAGTVDGNSRKFMIYQDDQGTDYSVQVNEAMGEAMGFDDVTDAALPPALPSYFEMRMVHAVDITGKVRQSFPVGKLSEDIFAEGGTIKVARKGSAAGVVLVATGTTGEKKRFVRAADTGQDGGDVS